MSIQRASAEVERKFEKLTFEFIIKELVLKLKSLDESDRIRSLFGAGLCLVSGYPVVDWTWLKRRQNCQTMKQEQNKNGMRTVTKSRFESCYNKPMQCPLQSKSRVKNHLSPFNNLTDAFCDVQSFGNS